LGGCSPQRTKEVAVANKKESFEEVLLARTPEIQPPWATGQLPEDEDYLYFVGISGKHATEVDAREEAGNDARNQFVKYTGIDAKIINEFLSASFGLESQVTDATESRISQEKQVAEAYYRRLKLVEYTLEKYGLKQGETITSQYVKVKALVRVPKSEYDQVQEWKKNREQKAEEFLDKAQLNYEKTIQDGNLLAAITELDEFIILAEKQPLPTKFKYISKASILKTNLLESVSIERASEKDQSIKIGEKPRPFKIKVTYKYQREKINAYNYPVLFMAGNIENLTTTDENGIAQLNLPRATQELKVSIVAFTDTDRLAQRIPDERLVALAKDQENFYLVVDTPFIEDKAKSEYLFQLSTNDKKVVAVNETITISGLCSERCFVRIYTWDTKHGILLFDSDLKLIKNKQEVLANITPKQIGKYKIIGLSRTSKFQDKVKRFTEYTTDEFAVILKNFRNTSSTKRQKKAEFQFDLEVK